jgi:hypothetical protein
MSLLRKLKKNKTPPRPEPGAWEPMMLVVALAMAAGMAFWIYGDRMPLEAKWKDAAPKSQHAATAPLPRS